MVCQISAPSSSFCSLRPFVRRQDEKKQADATKTRTMTRVSPRRWSGSFWVRPIELAASARPADQQDGFGGYAPPSRR
jgi:hypothetical protein